LDIVRHGEGLDLMNKIRVITVTIEDDETRQMRAQQALRNQSMARAEIFVGLLLGTLILFVLFSIAAMLANIRDRERIIADKSLAQAESAALTRQLKEEKTRLIALIRELNIAKHSADDANRATNCAHRSTPFWVFPKSSRKNCSGRSA
jgi:uncharacterized membrane protein YgaE (UPF0421/DUF939 family)